MGGIENAFTGMPLTEGRKGGIRPDTRGWSISLALETWGGGGKGKNTDEPCLLEGISIPYLKGGERTVKGNRKGDRLQFFWHSRCVKSEELRDLPGGMKTASGGKMEGRLWQGKACSDMQKLGKRKNGVWAAADKKSSKRGGGNML